MILETVLIIKNDPIMLGLRRKIMISSSLLMKGLWGIGIASLGITTIYLIVKHTKSKSPNEKKVNGSSDSTNKNTQDTSQSNK